MLAERRGQIEAGHSRHLDVGDDHVRMVLQRERQRFGAVTGFADDLEIAFDVEKRAQRAEHHGLILGDEDPDHDATIARATSGRRGTTSVSRVPRRASRSIVPPISARRARIPQRDNDRAERLRPERGAKSPRESWRAGGAPPALINADKKPKKEKRRARVGAVGPRDELINADTTHELARCSDQAAAEAKTRSPSPQSS